MQVGSSDAREAGGGMGASDWCGVAIIGLALVLFAFLWSDYRDYWLDDAFITFRYAQHLAEGLGPVFNPGERVEGYTSFLWMLLAALPLSVASVASALQGYKVFALLVSFWVLIRVARFPTPEGERPTRWLVLVLACQPIFVLNCGDGMETPLLVLLMLETMLALQAAPSRQGGAWCGLIVAGLVWTRPESLPLAVAAPALIAFAHRGDSKLREWVGAFAIASLLPIAGHVLFRFFYYGALWPNTFYAKATGDFAARLGRGGTDLSRFFFENPWSPPVGLWVLSVLAVVASWRALGALRARHPQVVCWFGALWLMVLFRVSFDLWSGSDTMGRHRFVAPILVPLAVLADQGARVLWRGHARFVVAGALLIAVAFNLAGHEIHARTTRPYVEGLERGHMALGSWLRESQPEDALLAIADAGAVPFFSRLETVDLWGLNDATIARLPGEYGDRPGMVDYVMERDPDLIVLWNQRPFLGGGRAGARVQGRVIGGQPLDRAIATDERFRARYRFRREFAFRDWSDRRPDYPGYYLDVFEKRTRAANARGLAD